MRGRNLYILIGLTVCSLNTPPGTKVLLKGESLPMSHGLLLLQQSMVQVLGGKVTALVDKWELNRVSNEFHLFVMYCVLNLMYVVSLPFICNIQLFQNSKIKPQTCLTIIIVLTFNNRY